MTLFLLGVNHRTAVLEDREALALSSPEVLDLLERLGRRGVLGEALVLSTCNRTEVYAVAAEITAAEQEVRGAVEQLRGRDLLGPGPHPTRSRCIATAGPLNRYRCGPGPSRSRPRSCSTAPRTSCSAAVISAATA